MNSKRGHLKITVPEVDAKYVLISAQNQSQNPYSLVKHFVERDTRFRSLKYF